MYRKIHVDTICIARVVAITHETIPQLTLPILLIKTIFFWAGYYVGFYDDSSGQYGNKAAADCTLGSSIIQPRRTSRVAVYTTYYSTWRSSKMLRTSSLLVSNASSNIEIVRRNTCIDREFTRQQLENIYKIDRRRHRWTDRQPDMKLQWDIVT